jgi:hypothetical protein
MSQQLEETGTDEILEILKNPKKLIPVRQLSKSTPDFYNSKKICLKGKVLHKCEVSAFSSNTKAVPERVFNPFMKNFVSNETDKYSINTYSRQNIKFASLL